MASLRDYYNSGPEADVLSAWGSYWEGQTFTPSEDYYLSSVRMKLYRVGLPGTITLDIRATSSGIPATVLTTTTFDGDVITNDSGGEWVDIPLPEPYGLVEAGTMYAIVLHKTGGDISNRIVGRGYNDSPPGPYAGGWRVRSSNAGASWASDINVDVMFETYGEDITTPITFSVAGAGTIFADLLASTSTVLNELIPRPETPFVERIQFLTSILRSVGGAEQRIALRQTPRIMYEMKIADRREYLESLLYRRSGEILVIPHWHEPVYLTQKAFAGDDHVHVTSTGLSEFSDGGYAIVYKDSFVHNVLVIDTVSANEISFTSLLLDTFSSGTQVMPVRSVYLDGGVSVSRKFDYVEYDLKVLGNADGNDLGVAPYDDEELYLTDVNYSDDGGVSESISELLYTIESPRGVLSRLALRSRSDRGATLGFRTHTREELWTLREFLYQIQGRKVSFYLSTFAKDLVLAAGLTGAQSHMDVVSCGYSLYVNEERDIRVILKDGTVLERTIQSWSQTDDQTERLIVDSAWPYSISLDEVDRIEYIYLMRLDTDDIKIRHINALGVATCDVPVVTCTNFKEWILPTYINDTTNDWLAPDGDGGYDSTPESLQAAGDGLSDTFAYDSVPAGGWSDWLSLTCGALHCFALRFTSNKLAEDVADSDLELQIMHQDDGLWYSVYNDNLHSDQVSYEVQIGPVRITQARIRMRNSESMSTQVRLYEFAFYGIK